MGSFRKQGNLRIKLLNREPLDRSATGQSIAEMLKEAKDVNHVHNPYLFSMVEIETRLMVVGLLLEDTGDSLEDLWRQEYRKVEVNAEDIGGLPKYLKAVTFSQC